MKKPLITLFEPISLFLLVFLLTACPSPGKIKKAMELEEEWKFQKKFERLFNQSVNKQKTELLFSSVVKSPGPTIHLNLKHNITTVDWLEELRVFQTKLKQTHTEYLAVVINDDSGQSYSYTPESLAFYEKTYNLFKKNLQQIKEGRIEDLFKTMSQTKQEFKEIKGLIDYVQITNFHKTKLACYPSEEEYQKMAFCLEQEENTKLYFSYIQTESEISLFRIDFNSFSSFPSGDILGERRY